MASEKQELDWIEQPDGWEGDENENENNNDNGESDGDGDDELGFVGFDLFADQNAELTFPFDVTLSGDQTVRLRLEGFTLGSDETAQSTGVTLWQAAPRLARYIAEETAAEELVRGKSILELGAGLGLCGMVAHHLGAENVVLTDADTITLQRMRTNLEKNCPREDKSTKDDNSISCRQLIWNNVSQMEDCGQFDTVLGADVIYTIESLDPLFDTVAFFLGNETDAESKGREKGRRSFVLSRYTKYGSISDETVLDAARARNLEWTRPSEGIFVFRRCTFVSDKYSEAEPDKAATAS